MRIFLAMLPCSIFLALAFMLYCLCGDSQMQNAPPPIMPLDRKSLKHSKCKDVVAFHLALNRGGSPLGISSFTLGAKAELNNRPLDLRSKIPLVLATKYGVLLYNNTEDAFGPANYVLGRVDEIEIKALQNLTWDSFGISDNDAYVFDVAIDASFYVLELQHQGHFMSFKTWEGYKNQDPESRRVAINGLDTKAGIPVYLPEFYDKWKTAKEEIFNLGKSIVDKEDTIPVDVTFENNLLTVYNKEGDTLLELDFSPVDSGTKTSDE